MEWVVFLTPLSNCSLGKESQYTLNSRLAFVDAFGKEKIFCCHRHPDDQLFSRDSAVAIPTTLSQPDYFV
jgi:hypothetical protein